MQQTSSPQPFKKHNFQPFVDTELQRDKSLRRLRGEVRCPSAWMRDVAEVAKEMIANENFTGDWIFENEQVPM